MSRPHLYTSHYTEKEWCEMHGYNESHEPLQRFVWEGRDLATPPSKDEVEQACHLWICRRLGDSLAVSSHLPAVLRSDEGIYKLTIMDGLDDTMNIVVDATDLSYEQLLQKAMTIFMLNWRPHGT